MQYFPPGWHFAPFSPYKSLHFYKDILVQTESVQIKAIYDRTDQTKVIYHSLYIKKIIIMSEWVLILQISKNFKDMIIAIVTMIIWKIGWRFSFIKINPSVTHGFYNLITNSKVKSFAGSYGGGISTAQWYPYYQSHYNTKFTILVKPNFDGELKIFLYISNLSINTRFHGYSNSSIIWPLQSYHQPSGHL